MTSSEVKIQLTAIRENLPAQYSQSAARKLMSSYENYKHILQVLGHSYSSISSTVRAALPEIGIKIPLADIYSGPGLTGKSTDGKVY